MSTIATFILAMLVASPVATAGPDLEVARGTPELATGNAGGTVEAEASDDRVKARVAAWLAADPSLRSSDVTVPVVRDGVVLLGGSAQTARDHLHAIEVAGVVPGVRRVVSEIETPDHVADGEIRQELLRRRFADRAAHDQAVSFGRMVKDAWVTAVVKLRLLADPDVPGLKVDVDTRDGVVTLFGLVGSVKAKKDAEVAVLETSGVRSVRNDLQIVPDAAVDEVEERDDAVDDRIAAALDGDSRLEHASIDVDVSNGVARLTGTVDSRTKWLTAAVVTRAVPGVCAVQNDLRLSDG